MAQESHPQEPAAAVLVHDARSDGADGLQDADNAELIGKPLLSRVSTSDVQYTVDPEKVGEPFAQVTRRSTRCRRWRSFQICLRALVKTPSFNMACMMVILCSSMLLGLEAGFSEDVSGQWFFIAADYVMTTLFVLEWTLRFMAAGWAFLRDPLNIMFTAVVWVPFFLSAGPETNSIRVVVRCLRLGKVVNTIKHIKKLKTIWLLVTGLFGSAMTLMWSCILIFLTVFFFSILAVEIVGHSAVWEDAEAEQNCSECYWPVRLKTVGSAMFVMTRFMNHDGAMDVLESVLTRQKHLWVFFYAFMAISVYVLLNLVTAIIVDRALQIVEQDEEQKAKEAIDSRKKEMKELTQLFRDLDSDGSGSITKLEFQRAFKIDALQVKLQLMGIGENQLQELFDTLNSGATAGDDTLDLQEFCKGLPKMFGDAKSYDMLNAQKKLDKCVRHFDAILKGQGMQTVQKQTDRKLEDITSLVDMMDFLENMTKERLTKLEQGVRDAMTLAEHAASVIAC